MDYDKAQKLLAKYRKDNRPKLYSADTNQESVISAEFEAELILMDNSIKRSLMQRLRGISDTTTTNSITNNLMKKAVEADTAAEADRMSELQFTLGDLQSFEKKLLDTSPMAEMQSAVGVLTRSAGAALFEYDQALNRATHSAVMKLAMDNNKSQDTKRELSAWINVLSAYITM